MDMLIFGAAGFIGRHLLEFLIRDKTVSHITAVIHHRRLPPELCGGKVHEINDTETLPEKSFDAVILLTGMYTPKAGVKTLRIANLETPKKIVDFCKKSKSKQVIFASSINVRLSESKGYAAYKREMEAYLIHSGVPYTIFRLALVFGDGDTGLSRIYHFIKRFPFVPVFGDGRKLEQPINVQEAAEFFYRASLLQPENKIYEIGGLKAYSYNGLMKAMAEVIGKKIAIPHIPARPVFRTLCFLESLGLRLPVNSEQILHIDRDLDINNLSALEKFGVELKPFEEWLREKNEIYPAEKPV